MGLKCRLPSTLRREPRRDPSMRDGNSPQLERMSAPTMNDHPCPLWIISGHCSADRACPLCP